MKLQKAQKERERTPHPAVVNQLGTAVPSSKTVHQLGSSFDDLHGRITKRAYELYVQGGCREGRAVEDWLDAEREIVSREFPVSCNAERGDSL